MGAGDSCDIVDPVSLRSSNELYKSLAVISGERKYLAGASGIKISDKEQPFPRLRSPVVCAVAHIPFETIPQLMKRGEDGRKRLSLVCLLYTSDAADD